MTEFEVFLPGKTEPTDLQGLVKFIEAGGYDGKGGQCPDFFQFVDKTGACKTIQKPLD